MELLIFYSVVYVRTDVHTHARTHVRTSSQSGVSASLEQYDPGAQCGVEYYMMYGEFTRVQKYEFLIFIVQDKKHLYMF